MCGSVSPRRWVSRKLPASCFGKLRPLMFDHERHSINCSMGRPGELLLGYHSTHRERALRLGGDRFKRRAISVYSNEALSMRAVLLACCLPVAKSRRHAPDPEL